MLHADAAFWCCLCALRGVLPYGILPARPALVRAWRAPSLFALAVVCSTRWLCLRAGLGAEAAELRGGRAKRPASVLRRRQIGARRSKRARHARGAAATALRRCGTRHRARRARPATAAQGSAAIQQLLSRHRQRQTCAVFCRVVRCAGRGTAAAAAAAVQAVAVGWAARRALRRRCMTRALRGGCCLCWSLRVRPRAAARLRRSVDVGAAACACARSSTQQQQHTVRPCSPPAERPPCGAADAALSRPCGVLAWRPTQVRRCRARRTAGARAAADAGAEQTPLPAAAGARRRRALTMPSPAASLPAFSPPSP